MRLFDYSVSTISTPQQLQWALSADVDSMFYFEFYRRQGQNISYLHQINLDQVFAKENPNAENLLRSYLAKCNVNVSNNLGMTLLHTLIWADRPDLAKSVVESPKFTHINFKFDIPTIKGSLRASALDLAIGLWCYKETAMSLEFIALLLAYGALPPKPEKKFLTSNMLNVFYPHLMLTGPQYRSQDEFRNLFYVLSGYGFSLKEMEKEMRKRLFDASDNCKSYAKTFAEKYAISVEEQTIRFNEFMTMLYAYSSFISKGIVLVEMTAERLDDGKDLRKPVLDTDDRKCCVM